MSDGLRIESAVAQDLITWARNHLGQDAGPSVVFEHISAALREHLGRWIGADAFDALAGRAAHLERARCAALKRAEWRPSETPALSGVEAELGPDADPFAPILVILTALVDLLGRFIGQEMACRLVRDGLIDTPDSTQQRDEAST